MKVGIEVWDDIKRLGHQNGIDIGQALCFDLRFMACHAGFLAIGLASLVHQGLNRKLSKSFW